MINHSLIKLVLFIMAGVVYMNLHMNWANLRGAVASLSIGVIVYLLIVRGCLMSFDKNGRSVYINVWLAKLDIEKNIYKPLLLNILPFVGALFARVIGSIVTWVSALGYKLFMAFKIKWNSFIDSLEKSEVVLKAGYDRLNEKIVNATEPIWEGKADLTDAIATFTEYDMVSEDQRETVNEGKEFQAESHDEKPMVFLEWWRKCWDSFLTKIADKCNQNLDKAKKVKTSHAEKEITKVIASSLIYSFSLLLIGMLVIVLIVLIKK